MMNKSSLFLTALIAMLFAQVSFASPVSQNPPLEQVKLQLKFFHQFQFAGYYAAKAQGYYAQEGLDVEINQRQLGQDYVKEVLAGKIDFAIGDSGIVAQYARGDSLVALAAIFQHDALVLFSKQSSGIISPYEMRGKRVMYDVVGENNAPVRSLLADIGLDENHYSAVAETFDIEDLVQDRVDVMSGYLTDKPLDFQQRNIKVNIINPQNYGIDFYGDLLFTSRQELIQHPGRAERFRRASIKGWQYALDHPEEIIQLISSQYHSQRSVEQLRYEAIETRKLIMPEQIPIGQIETKRLKRVAETYANLKLAPRVSEEQLQGFVFNSKSDLNLSIEERNWLNQHPLIKVGIDRNFPPYGWINQQENYVGMAAEQLQWVQKKLGVRFEFVKDLSGAQILNRAQRGELDMLAAAVKTPSTQQYLDFIAPYANTSDIVIGNDKIGYIAALRQLAGHKVAVVKGYFNQELLAREYPDIEVVASDDVAEALKLVAKTQVDAYIGDAVSASYIIREQGLINLRFVGQTGYQSEISFAVSNQQPELLAILQKALNSIPENKRDEINHRWLSIIANPGVSPELLTKYAQAACLILVLFAYWVYRLRREIKARRLSEAELVMLYNNMSLGFALYHTVRNSKGKIFDARYVTVNPVFSNIVGMNAESYLGKLASDTRIPCLSFLIKHLAEVDSGSQSTHLETQCAVTGRWLEAYSYQVAPQRFVLLLQDITQRKQNELALKSSEEKLRLSQQYGGISTWAFDMVNNRRIWSEILANGLGVPKTENPKWAHFLASVCKEDRPLVIDALRRHIKNGEKFDVEYRINVASRRCWMRSVGQVERDEHGKPTRMLGIVQDISQRKSAEEKLKLSARVFSDAHEGIMITDANAQILDVNQAFSDLTGYCLDDLIGANPRLLKSGKQDEKYYLDMWGKLVSEGHWQGEIWNRHKNGGIYAQLLTISALRDENGVVMNYIGLFSDITESKMYQQKLEYLAHYDPLTNLPNRSLFADRFLQAIAHSKRFGCLLAVCYLDLDGFKPVNDQFGHDVGDELLVEVAKRIKANLRECDTVSRLGGDEFALLLQDLNSIKQCEETLKRIHLTLAEPFILHDQPIWISASAGITLYPLDGAEPDILLRHADQAMYQAKRSGRNCYRIYQELIDLELLQADTVEES
jgi:diguanylate cyclase (GGDEF)-like protein/PAS domain S-box-containing protein